MMWICITLWILIFSLFCDRIVDSTKNETIESITNSIVSNLKLTQVIITVNSITTPDDKFYHGFISKVPTLLIKINDTEKLQTLTEPTITTLFVIIETRDFNGLYLKRLKFLIDKLAQLSPISVRPKCLVLLYSYNNTNVSDLNDILTHAWSFQFLDFTFFILISKDSYLNYNYNPFTKNFSGMDLFPNKLQNLHGYSIKVPSIELPPYSYVIRNSDGNIIDMGGMSYQYFKIMSNVMNFTVEFITGLENSVIRGNFSVLFEKLRTCEIDLLTFPFNVRSIMYDFKDWLIMGRLFLNTNYVLIVPIMPLLKIDIPLDVVCSIPLFFVIIVVFKVMSKLMKFPKKNWTVDKIFQILLGVTVIRNKPRRIVEKILYLSLIIVCMKYSVDTLTKIMDIKLIKGEINYDTLEDIAESKLPIFTLDFVIKHVYSNNDDEIIKLLRERTEPIVDIMECIYQAVENKSCMCITPHSAGAYVAKHYINADGTPNTKVARPSLYDDMAAFGYSRNSPFSSRMDFIIQRIVESGVDDIWSTAEKYTIKKSDFVERKPISQNIFLLQLYAILSIGYLMAGLAFIIEFVCKSRERILFENAR